MQWALGLSAEDPPDWVLAEFPAGVGMIRGEYLMRDAGAYIAVPEVSQRVTSYLVEIASRTASPVWYRTSDLDAQEASVLRGVEEAFFEPVPQLGTRGIRRGMRFPRSFEEELKSFARAQKRCQNLRVFFPFLTTTDEAEFACKAARSAGIKGPLGLMAETPAAIMILPELLELGFSHVVVGCNDLWGLTMAQVRAPGRYPSATAAVVRMLQLGRASAEAAGASIFIAGYLDKGLLDVARDLSFDAAVAHYAQLPGLLGPRFLDLPDLDRMADIKQRTREAIRIAASQQETLPSRH